LDSRILIAIILSLATIFAYQELVLKRLYPTTNEHAVPPQARPKGVAPSPSPLPKALPTTGVKPAEVAPRAGAAAAAARSIEVDTALYHATFTSRGARLKSMRLERFRETSAPNSPPLEMVRTADGAELPLGLVVSRAGSTIDDRDIDYQSDAPARIEVRPGQPQVLTFTAKTSNGLSLVKTFTFKAADYVFDMSAEVTDPTSTSDKIGFEISEPLTRHKGYYDITKIQADLNDKALAEDEKQLKKGVAPMSGTLTYAGFGDRYFLAVLLPQTAANDTLLMDYDSVEAHVKVLFPGEHGNTLRAASRVYLGPKDLDVLEAINPKLSTAIELGWTRILALALLRTLKLFHRVAPNYGVDIVLLTVAIRLLLLPMSIKSQRSMMRLQRLQPQVERIREKFKDDRERLNREMVDLYKRNHVNPMGGCAPMALQLPIFIGLYYALGNAVELRHAPFVGWIRDLSAPDCLRIPGMPPLPFTECGGIPVLVLLMGLSTFLQQWMSPQSADPSQQRMMMLMPIVFTVMLVNFPAGLSLYYLSSNVVGVIQQYVLNREFKQLSPVNA
jgi:YidC/Oxa1 family membrane protein insertase